MRLPDNHERVVSESLEKGFGERLLIAIAVVVAAACSSSAQNDPTTAPATATEPGRVLGPASAGRMGGPATSPAAPPSAPATTGAPLAAPPLAPEPPACPPPNTVGSEAPTSVPPPPPEAGPPLAPRPETPLDPATVAARKNKNDPNLNFLTYQHLDQLYNTRLMPAGTTKWELRQSKRTLPADFSFNWNGRPTQLIPFMIEARMNALLVMKDGDIVTEIYRHGSDANSRFSAMSMSKSVLSALYGIALEDGILKSVDEPIVTYIPELKGTAYDSATIKNLLMMRAGNAWDENTDGLGMQRTLSIDEERAYYEDFALRVRATSAPGTTFNYSTLDSCVLGWALANAIDRPLAEFASERLWKPAGMERDGYWVLQGPSDTQREFFGAGLNATLRDLGRFGQLMLNEGVANGTQVVPKAWVTESTSRGTPPAPYMYQWWGGEGTTDFSAEGHGGQTINVDPTNQTVIVMLSYYDGNEQPGLHRELLRAIKNALR